MTKPECQNPMGVPDEMLDESRFIALWAISGGRDGGKVFGELHALYTAPDRHYHGLAHIMDCLVQMDSAALRTPELELALWFHDAIYDSRRNDNEEQSAQVFLRAAEGLPVELQATVARLIRVTAKHQPEAEDERLICDIDLSILGRPENEYRDYVEKVRCEYAWVSAADWNAGRARVLRSFLSREALFHTARFKPLEDAARRNLLSELSALTGA